MKPGSPLPGSTSRSSSVNTLQLTPISNLDVCVPPSAVVIDEPKPTASDAPKLSVSAVCRMCFSRPCFTSELHITPEDTMFSTLDRFQRPGFSSSVCSIGLANASPTMAIDVTPLASTVSQRFTGLNLVFSDRVTTAPPFSIAPIAVNQPVPCISGQAGSWREKRPATSAFSTCSSIVSGTGRPILRTPSMLASRQMLCVHITPFGRPVVPPV